MPAQDKRDLELIIDKMVRKNGKEKKVQFTVRLDPARYERRTQKGEKGFFDKAEKIFIPEGVFKIMMEEMTTQPIQSVDSTIEDLYTSILESQIRTRRALRQGLKFETAIVPSERYLETHLNTMQNVAVLYVDIAGSTNLGMVLPGDKLATLIKIFVQEMSYLVSAYHGYVLKSAGDCVIAYFPARTNLTEGCSEAVNCARAMINMTGYALNPVLAEENYPELMVKIGIDVGENQIVRLGGQVDLLGYTMSIAAKMVDLAEPGQIIIGKWVYQALKRPLRRLFKRIKPSPHIWNYRDSREGKFYGLFLHEERIKRKDYGKISRKA
ncbi:MAG: adenylate/guanylate cyclase domain-containing protein [Nitrososphaerales archaeon]